MTAEVISLEKDAFVEFSQNYNPDWRAYIDDIETQIYYVNGTQQGIIVPAGQHTIRFKYVDYSIVVLGILDLVLLLSILIGGALIMYNKNKKKG